MAAKSLAGNLWRLGRLGVDRQNDDECQDRQSHDAEDKRQPHPHRLRQHGQGEAMMPIARPKSNGRENSAAGDKSRRVYFDWAYLPPLGCLPEI